MPVVLLAGLRPAISRAAVDVDRCSFSPALVLSGRPRGRLIHRPVLMIGAIVPIINR
jgi:hypothetical protein